MISITDSGIIYLLNAMKCEFLLLHLNTEATFINLPRMHSPSIFKFNGK